MHGKARGIFPRALYRGELEEAVVLLLQRRDGLVHHADLSSYGGPVHFAHHPNPEPNKQAFKHVWMFVTVREGRIPTWVP